MTARAAVQSILEGDTGAGPETLASLGFTLVVASNSVDTPPDDRFLIVKWLDTNQVFGDTGPKSFQIWAHDKDRDYTQIGLALKRVKDLLSAVTHVVGEDGWTLTQADWRGEGPDLYDGGYETCTRYADFQAATRYTAS